MLKVYSFNLHIVNTTTHIFTFFLNISSSFTYMPGHEVDVFASADDITSS